MPITSYEEIFDLFLNKINDYYIKNQIELDIDFANEILLGYLRSSIPKFSYSAKDLSERDDALFQFNISLNDLEKEILSILMVVEYLSPKMLREEYLQNRLGSKDYDTFSPSNQLNQLRELKKDVMHDANLLMTEYYYRQGI